MSQGLLGDVQWRRELVFAVTAAISVIAAPGATRKLLTAAVLVVALAGYALAVRGAERVQPAALAICAVAGIIAILLAPNGLAEWPVLLAATHLRTVFKGDVGIVLTAVLAVAFATVIFWASNSPVGLLAGLGVPILAQRRLEQVELQNERDRAVRLLAELEQARDAQAEAAALKERGRIAREMHDVLAHSLAGLSLQLQAARAVATRENAGPAVLEPLERAADLARSGVEEANAVMGALRSPARLGSGIADLQTLIERFPGDATLLTTGEAQPLSPAGGHAIYRAVQESLTNAARYAPGSQVRVVMQWDQRQLRVFVIDDGPGDTPVPGGQGSGLGLSGMRERVASVGGQLVTGPDDNGWRTEIVVPVIR
jgi:signal transduction histidine kinase